MVISDSTEFVFHPENIEKNPYKDLPEERRFKITDSCDAIAYRDPIFGLWKIKYSVGPVPEFLSGSWNNIKQVEKSIEDYKLLKNASVTRRHSQSLQRIREHKEFLRNKKLAKVL